MQFCSDYDSLFRALEDNAETSSLNFSFQVAKLYNAPFCMDELTALVHCHMSLDPASIHNQMLVAFHL
jgi:hypothetical protein